MFEIEEFTEKPRPVVAGIIGRPGDGKTLTSLYLAVGIAGSPERVLFIDNEGGRGREYAGMPEFKGIKYVSVPYSTTSNQYAQFIGGGVLKDPSVSVIVFDSGSNEYNSILEYADSEEARLAAAGSKRGQNVWKAPKAAHKRFRDALLFSGKSVITTFLLSEKLDGVNTKNPRYIESVLCEKNDPAAYDFMIDISRGESSLDYGVVKNSPFLKVIEKYRAVISPGVRLSQDVGRALIAATSMGQDIAPNINASEQAVENALRSGAGVSQEELDSRYDMLDPQQQEHHRPLYDSLAELPDLDNMREEAKEKLFAASEGGLKTLGTTWLGLQKTHKLVINELVAYKDNLKSHLEKQQ